MAEQEMVIPMADGLLAKSAWKTIQERNDKYVSKPEETSGMQEWMKDQRLPPFFRSKA